MRFGIETQKLTALSTFGLAIVTFGLVLSMSQQTNLMQQEFDVNQRPWISITDMIVTDNSIKIVYENFGNIPNNGGTVRGFGTTETIPDRNYFLTNAGSQPMKIIFPDQKLEMNIRDLPSEDFDEIYKGNVVLYIGFKFEYEYGKNKIGEYGTIGKYNTKTGLVDIIDSWAS